MWPAHGLTACVRNTSGLLFQMCTLSKTLSVCAQRCASNTTRLSSLFQFNRMAETFGPFLASSELSADPGLVPGSEAIPGEAWGLCTSIPACRNVLNGSCVLIFMCLLLFDRVECNSGAPSFVDSYIPRHKRKSRITRAARLTPSFLRALSIIRRAFRRLPGFGRLLLRVEAVDSFRGTCPSSSSRSEVSELWCTSSPSFHTIESSTGSW